MTKQIIQSATLTGKASYAKDWIVSPCPSPVFGLTLVWSRGCNGSFIFPQKTLASILAYDYTAPPTTLGRLVWQLWGWVVVVLASIIQGSLKASAFGQVE
ncbi:hypothetical protein GE253_19390 [Niveispirillum sp. SYP-B3756]|nr:hypothetical protein [Niveispirillum sp. SYP-B3756]